MNKRKALLIKRAFLARKNSQEALDIGKSFLYFAKR